VYCVGTDDEGSRLVGVACQLGRNFLPMNDVLQDCQHWPCQVCPILIVSFLDQCQS